VCETLGRNLAIIKTDADMADLNTTVVLSKLNKQGSDENPNRIHIGLLRTSTANNWTWYTGEVLDVAWPYWRVGEPGTQDTSYDRCARIVLKVEFWLFLFHQFNVRDKPCENEFPIILCE